MSKAWPEVKPKNHQQEAEQFKREAAADRAAAGLPPDTTVELPSYVIDRLQLEKDQLLEAMRLPEPKPAPEPAPRIPDEALVEALTEGVVITMADEALAAAVQEQDDALAAVQEANRRLEAANTALAIARQDQVGVHHQQNKNVAQRKLQPLIEKVTRQRRELQAVHNRVGETLKTFAQSLATGDLRERTLLQQIYGEAGPIANRLGVAFKATETALKLLTTGHVSAPESLDWSVGNATSAAETTLAMDPAKIQRDADALIARYHAIRPKLPTGPRLGHPELAGINSEPQTNWNR